MKTQLILLKAYFGILSAIAPKKAGKKGFEIFQKVRKKDIRPREESFFENAEKFQVKANLDVGKTEDIDCYAMGKINAPLVILVHGWDSNAGSMSQLANRFVSEGKYVVLFNLPGHAFSKSDATNMLECRMAFSAILEYLKPTDGFSIISHSFGSLIVSYTLAKNNYKVDRLIFLTSPNELTEVFTGFKNGIGLGKKAYQHLLKLTEKKLGESLEAVSTCENLYLADFNKLLILHDKNDKVIPFSNSIEIKNGRQNVTLIPYENIGHYKMLWNKDIIDACVRFFKD